MHAGRQISGQRGISSVSLCNAVHQLEIPDGRAGEKYATQHVWHNTGFMCFRRISDAKERASHDEALFIINGP
jgi:hypothetical protein